MQRSQKKNVSSGRSQSSPTKSKARTQPKARSSPRLGVASMSGMSRPYASPLNHRLRNKDLIANGITAFGGSTTGATVSFRIPCNPRLWPGTKAYQESLGYQCYSPKSITAHWLPAVSTTTAGQIIAGSLSVRQEIGTAAIANALMSVPGSCAGPVWKEMSFRFDLSVLTQPRYFLDSVDDDGVPCVMYMVFPQASTTVDTLTPGLVELDYEFEFFGQCAAPLTTPVYDLAPRAWTTSNSSGNPVGVLSSGTGLVTYNQYTATICGTLAAAIQLLGTSVGTGASVIDFNQFGSRVTGVLGSNATYLNFLEGGITPYPATASLSARTYVFIQGPSN